MECYIINRMYAGEFLGGRNIGHEIVNLFSSDLGENYIYANPSGTINPKYEDRVKKVFLVRKSDSIHKLEVLGIAEIEDQIARKSSNLDPKKRTREQYDSVDKYIAEHHPITYGGKDHRTIFSNNKFKKAYLNDNYLMTFKAKRVLLPFESEEGKVYITDDKSLIGKNTFYLPGIRFSRQSLKQYVDNETKFETFEKLKEISQNSNLWDAERKTEKIKIAGKRMKEDAYYNYLDIIGRQDDENVFSNLISYFLDEDRNLFKKFCKEVLELNISEDAIIEREKDAEGSRIDIFIEDEENVVVIENKIKSEVNSVIERHRFNGELIQSQLADYCKFVKTEFKDKKHHFFILMPNYHHIDIKKYKDSEKYTKLNYDKLYKFFSKHDFSGEEKAYYQDFVKALHRHSEDYYDDQYVEMKRRFIKRLEEI